MQRRANGAVVLACTMVLTACGSTALNGATTQSLPDDAGAAGLATDDQPGASVESELGLALKGDLPDSSTPSGSGVASGPASPLAAPPAQTGAGQSHRPGGPGRPADRTPLKVGLLYVDNDGAAAAGVRLNNSTTPRRVLEALVATANKRQGLAGRRLVPTYVAIKSSSSSYETDLQAACATFAQDHKVDAVISQVFISESFYECLARAGITEISGSYGTADAQAANRTPSRLAPISMTGDRIARNVLEQLARSRYLTRESRLGVLLEDCPYNRRAFDASLEPTAKRLGIPMTVQSVRCFTGSTAMSAMTSDVQAAVLKFSSERVDRVMAFGAEGEILFLFATSAEQQRYRPGYVMSSRGVATSQVTNSPREQVKNMRGVGWLPAFDSSAHPAVTPVAKACLKRLSDERVPPPTATADFMYAFGFCDGFDLLEHLLQRSGGSADLKALRVSAAAVGTSFAASAVVEGRTDFTGRTDGAARGRVFGWSDRCDCFAYTGASFAL